MTTTITLGYDCGQGNGKLVGPHGWALLESYASRARPERVVSDLGGIQSRKAQRTITFSTGQAFFVGRNAHAAGDPIEALDYDRYTGAPEQRALFYGIVSAYAEKHGVELHKIRLSIGVPLPVLSGADALEKVAAIQNWLSGEHTWMSNGKVYHMTIIDVQVKSQAAGALYSYMYDSDGKIIKEHKNKLVVAKAGAPPQFVPFAILSLGFLTMEVMAVQYERVEGGGLELVKDDRFTTSQPVGIHRLLDLARPGPGYTLAELDQQLRDGNLNISEAMTIYQRDVSNALIEAWGRDGWKRFGVILVVGGGAVTLGTWLTHRFEGRAFVPAAPIESNGHYQDGGGRDLMPILSIAEGLYRNAKR